MSKGHYLKVPGINVRIILKWIFKKWESVDWIDFAQNSDH
jgi:hypothetical protein